MSKLVRYLSLIIIFNSTSVYAFDFKSLNIEADFGLVPTTSKNPSKNKKSILPNCEDIKNIDVKNAPGVNANQGYCIGNVDYNKPPEREPALTLYSEIFDERGFTRIIKRNPFLLSLTAFFSVCRPLGGTVSTDSLYCEYHVEF